MQKLTSVLFHWNSKSLVRFERKNKSLYTFFFSLKGYIFVAWQDFHIRESKKMHNNQIYFPILRSICLKESLAKTLIVHINTQRNEKNDTVECSAGLLSTVATALGIPCVNAGEFMLMSSDSHMAWLAWILIRCSWLGEYCFWRRVQGKGEHMVSGKYARDQIGAK